MRGTMRQVVQGGWIIVVPMLLAACGGDLDFGRTIVTATAAARGLAPTFVAETRVPLRPVTAAPTNTRAAATAATAVTMVAAATMAPAAATIAMMGGTPTMPAATGAAPVAATATVAATTAASVAASASAVGGTRAATPAMTGATATTGPTTTFTDPGKRFSFSRPQAWREVPPTNKDIVALYVSDMPAGTFNVLVSSVPASTTLDAYVTANVATIKRDTAGYRDGPVGLRNGTIGGVAAKQFDYYAMFNSKQQYLIQLFCVRNGVSYVLTFVTPVDSANANMDAFNASGDVVVETWKFL